MYSFLSKYGCRARGLIKARMNCRSLAKLTEPLAAVEPKPKPLEFVAEDIINDSVGASSTTFPLIEPARNKVSPDIIDLPEARIEAGELEKTSLSLGDIPGPAVLKIWEKYWKYVPILGTQLVYSLLVNNLTEGKLTWNTRFRPLKYLFNHYGPIVRINGPMINDVVMIHRPEHIAQVLKQDGDSPMRCRIDVLEHYRINYRKYRLPGLFSMQGDEWFQTRAKLEKPFVDQTSNYLSGIDRTCEEFVERVRKIRNRQDEVPDSFDDELSRWGIECFSILVFDKRPGFFERTRKNSSLEAARIVDALKNAHLYLSKCETGFQVWRFFQTPYLKKLVEACDVIDNVVSNYIRQAANELSKKSTNFDNKKSHKGNEASPILEKLLINQKMKPDDISALLMDMIILGVQATANTQAFLLYFLAKNPRVQRKLHEEIVGTPRTRESTLTEKTIEQSTYLKACVKECLRLRPVFPYINRITSKSINLHGYAIPKGTCLVMANEIASQREENFEDPQKFKPERWLNDEMLKDNSWQDFSCMPFGHGARSCLGKNIAETQIMLLTSKLLREFRIEYDYADVKSKYLMVNVPNRPLRFRFVDRRAS